MNKWKKTAVIVLLSIFFIALGWCMWPMSKIKVVAVDQLGTKISPNKVIYGKIGTRVKTNILKKSGYEPDSQPFLIFNHMYSQKTVVYRPVQNKKQIKDKIQKYKYIGASFQVLNSKLGIETQNYKKLAEEEDRLRLVLSNDGIHWKRLAINYPNIAVRDPMIVKIKSQWWVFYTLGAMWTKDFKNWHHIYLNYNPNSMFQRVWAPEFYQLANGKRYIIVSASTDGVNFRIYRYKFNYNLKSLSSPEEISTLQGGRHINLIDPHIMFRQGKYILFAKDENQHVLVKSSSLDGLHFGKFQEVDLRLKHNFIPEGPTTVKLTQKAGLLYFDLYDSDETFSGVHAVRIKNNKVKTNVIKLKSDFLIRHFSVYSK